MHSVASAFRGEMGRVFSPVDRALIPLPAAQSRRAEFSWAYANVFSYSETQQALVLEAEELLVCSHFKGWSKLVKQTQADVLLCVAVERREEKRRGSAVAPGQDRGTSIISIYHMSVLDGGCDPGFYITFRLWHLGVNTSVASSTLNAYNKAQISIFCFLAF